MVLFPLVAMALVFLLVELWSCVPPNCRGFDVPPNCCGFLFLPIIKSYGPPYHQGLVFIVTMALCSHGRVPFDYLGLMLLLIIMILCSS